MVEVFACVVQRDLKIAFRRRSDVLVSLAFFVIVATLFPLGIGPEANLLREIAPGILWIAALLASMLGLSRLFASDYEDGSLEQLILSSEPLSVIVMAKVSAHWLISGLPLVLLAPLLAIQFDLPKESTFVLFLSLLLGTPVMSLIGAVGTALTLGIRGSNVLVSLLVLPLYIPILIFGSGAVTAEVSGLGSHAHLLLLGGGLAVTFALAPWTIALALRISIE